jgi:hypothetical protein
MLKTERHQRVVPWRWSAGSGAILVHSFGTLFLHRISEHLRHAI